MVTIFNKACEKGTRARHASKRRNTSSVTVIIGKENQPRGSISSSAPILNMRDIPYYVESSVTINVPCLHRIFDEQLRLVDIIVNSSTGVVATCELMGRKVIVKTPTDIGRLIVEIWVYLQLQTCKPKLCPEIVGFLPDSTAIEEIGEPLQEVNVRLCIAGKVLTDEEKRSLWHDAASKLGVIHKEGFQHGDIAARNIRIVVPNVVIWIDFGMPIISDKTSEEMELYQCEKIFHLDNSEKEELNKSSF